MSPGQVAPCPQGNWKAEVGTSVYCTKCAEGVTTPREASTSQSDCKREEHSDCPGCIRPACSRALQHHEKVSGFSAAPLKHRAVVLQGLHALMDGDEENHKLLWYGEHYDG